MKKALINSWYHKPYKALIPCAGLFRSMAAVRRCYYQRLKSQSKFSVPIIVVGNLTVGGTGKTPLVIAIVQYLQQQGFKPGIVSRGYGGNYAKQSLDVTGVSDPIQCGDETVLMAKRTGVPVVINRKRKQAVKDLLTWHDCNVVLSDDGLQHYAMPRDIEIVVVDGQRRLGNGYCLPAGPLREPAKRLQQADFIVCRDGQSHVGEHAMTIKPGDLQAMVPEVAKPNGGAVHAVAGIGYPERFFQSLRQAGFDIIPHAFADHHIFTAQDLIFNDNKPIIMTEKDAVKCQAFANSHMYYLPISAELSDDFWQGFTKKINDIHRHSRERGNPVEQCSNQ